jgi:TM2 domain-containing membrane protein YozV
MDDHTRQSLVYDAHKKSLVVAYLLWWFLGFFGAHRFYLGAIGSAVAMLVLTVASTVLMIVAVGLLGYIALGVWWIVDAFLLPSMVTQYNVRLIGQIR